MQSLALSYASNGPSVSTAYMNRAEREAATANALVAAAKAGELVGHHLARHPERVRETR